jgi:two-component system, chemotaxis family, chemotaxis protein CheY
VEPNSCCERKFDYNRGSFSEKDSWFIDELHGSFHREKLETNQAMRVLIVDDSRASRMVLQKIMRQFGFETIEAETGTDALWLLDRHGKIDLLTVDYHMPRMTGIEFVRRVREQEKFATIPILMVSVESSMEIQIDALEAGVSEYLIKPFTRDMVEDKLRLMGIEPASPESGDANRPTPPTPPGP